MLDLRKNYFRSNDLSKIESTKTVRLSSNNPDPTKPRQMDQIEVLVVQTKQI
jgi:hypothetical protein